MKKDCDPFVSIIVETEGFQSFLYFILFYLILPFLLLLLMQIVLDLSR